MDSVDPDWALGGHTQQYGTLLELPWFSCCLLKNRPHRMIDNSPISRPIPAKQSTPGVSRDVQMDSIDPDWALGGHRRWYGTFSELPLILAPQNSAGRNVFK